jgi:serine/threonine-protein kinase RsbW
MYTSVEEPSVCAPPRVSSEPATHDLAQQRLDADSGRRSIALSEEVPDLLAEVTSAMERAGYGARDTWAVRLSLDEAVINAVRHGHRKDPRKQARVWWVVTTSAVKLVVGDQGPGFDPAQVPDPRLPANRERAGGRGLFLIRAYMSWVRFNQRGNCLAMCRYRSGEGTIAT